MTFDGRNYKARLTHVAYGANWNPKANLTLLWQDVGACTGNSTPSPTPVITPKPTVPPIVMPTPVPPVAGCYVAWSKGKSFTAGDLVTFDGRNYKARLTHVAYGGAKWNPRNPKASLNFLWQDVGACTGNSTPSPTLVITPKPTLAPTATPTTMPSATPAPITMPAPNNCPAWSATATYIGGQCVAFNGKIFTTKWWTKGERPGAAQSPWALQAAAKRK